MAARYIRYWISSKAMTVQVDTVDWIIVECAPIARKFKGGNINGLLAWMGKQGDLRTERL